MCKCFSSAIVGTVAGLRAVCHGTVCKCFSSASVGTVFELL